jgi:hypothetical protein
MDGWGSSHTRASQFRALIVFEQLPSFESSDTIYSARVHHPIRRLALSLLISGILSPLVRPAGVSQPLTVQQVLAQMEERGPARFTWSPKSSQNDQVPAAISFA